jgi:hypothetical protein
MSPLSAGAVTAWSAVIAFVLVAPTVALYFVVADPPSTRVVLWRVLLSLLLNAALLVFVAGFAAVLWQTGASPWAVGLVFGSGVLLVAVTFVANAIQAGAVLRAGGRIDPTLMGTGAEASQVLYGPVTRLITAVFLTAAAAAVFPSALPGWLGWTALVTAMVHLVLVPTLLSSTDPARFFSLNGWNIPVVGGLFLLWVLLAGVASWRT